MQDKVKYILFLYTNIYSHFNCDINASSLEIEHILPKQWQNANFNGWDKETHNEYLEQIGNKILLPKKSNIKCIDNFFSKKQNEYKKNIHLQEVYKLGIANKNIWLKEDIESRNREIYNILYNFFKDNI